MSKTKNKKQNEAASKLILGGALLILAICMSKASETEKKELQETKRQASKTNVYQLVFNGSFALALLVTLIVLVSKM